MSLPRHPCPAFSNPTGQSHNPDAPCGDFPPFSTLSVRLTPTPRQHQFPSTQKPHCGKGLRYYPLQAYSIPAISYLLPALSPFPNPVQYGTRFPFPARFLALSYRPSLPRCTSLSPYQDRFLPSSVPASSLPWKMIQKSFSETHPSSQFHYLLPGSGNGHAPSLPAIPPALNTH